MKRNKIQTIGLFSLIAFTALCGGQDESRIAKILKSPYTPYALAALSGVGQSFMDYKSVNSGVERKIVTKPNNTILRLSSPLSSYFYLGGSVATSIGLSLATAVIQYKQRKSIDYNVRENGDSYYAPYFIQLLTHFVTDLALAPTGSIEKKFKNAGFSAVPSAFFALVAHNLELAHDKDCLTKENKKLQELLKKCTNCNQD